MAPAVPFSAPGGPTGGGSSSSGGDAHTAHDGCGGCCAPSDSKYFVQEDFRGDIANEPCYTLELSVGDSCKVRACLWREMEMKTQLVSSKSSPVIGFSTSITQDVLNAAIAACSKPSKKSLVPEGSIKFNLPRDADDPNYQLIDPVELMVMDAMGLPFPKYYKRRKSADGVLFVDLFRCTKKTDSGDITTPVLTPVDALVLLFSNWLSQLNSAITCKEDSSDSGAGQKKKSKVKQKNFLNLVVPNSFNSATRSKLVQAIKRAGAEVKGIYSRGLACVAGSLHRDKGQPSALFESIRSHAESVRKEVSPLVLNNSKSSTLSSTKESGESETVSKKNLLAEPVIVLFIDICGAFVELSLISCEGGGAGLSGANCMGFDRLVSLSRMGLQVDEAEDLWVSGVIVEIVQDLLRRAGDIDKQKISAILATCMDSTLDDLLRYLEDPNHRGMSSAPGKAFGDVGMPLSPSASVAPSPRGSPLRTWKSVNISPGRGPAVVKVLNADYVRGGCVLAAAELQSSKLFIHDGAENNFHVSYYLSVGEDDSGGVYGVVIKDPNVPEKPDKHENRIVGNRERTASGHKIAIDEKPKEIFSHHLRLTKSNVGPPLKQSQVSNLEFQREFNYTKSKLFYSESSDPLSLSGGAQLRLLQQV